MGLDMYLTAKKYVSEWNDEGKALGAKVGKLLKKAPGVVKGIDVEAGYWRKANAIHKWFVDHVQDGTDDCGEYYVSRDNLIDLRDLCQKVLATARLVSGKIVVGQRSTGEGWEDMVEDGEVVENEEEIAALLPCQSGFFFGGTGYDAWYLKDVEHTLAICNDALGFFDEKGCSEWSFYYQSSW